MSGPEAELAAGETEAPRAAGTCARCKGWAAEGRILQSIERTSGPAYYVIVHDQCPRRTERS